jgi:transposase
MWLVLASVQALVFAPMQETVRMAQVHVLTGPERRRRFSFEQKRAMVAAAFAPGAVVADVARRADVCSSLIYRWRRELGGRSGFAEVVVTPVGDGYEGGDGSGERRCLSAPPAFEAARPGAGDAVAAAAIEVEVGGSSRLRIPASTPPELAAAVIAALRRR